VNQEIDINSVARIKFLMEYDLSKAPHENVLLEQKVVSKLTDNQQLAKIAGYGDVTPQRADELAKAGLLIYAAKMAPMWLFKPDELLTDEERKKKEVWLINQEMKSMPNYTEVGPLPDRYNPIYDSPSEISGWDHDIAGYTELGLAGLGALLMATGVAAPVGVGLLAAGTSVGIADALHYFKEGKNFDGWLMLALQAIPGGDLLKSTPLGKLIPELSPILKKMADNKWLTDVERKIYEEASKLFKKLLPELAPFLRKQSFLLIRKILRQLPLLKVLKLYRGLAKVPAALGKLVIKVGRIAITFDQLWILMTKLDPSMKRTRDKSEFAQMLDALYKLPSAVIDMMFEAKNLLYNSDGTDNTEGQQQFTDACTTDDFMTGYLETVGAEYNEDIKTLIDTGSVTYDDGTTIKYTPPPVTIDSILRGIHTIRKGQKGQAVGEIQKMLLLLGYDLGETGKKGAGIDRDFGDTTEKAVIQFQKDNNLKDTSGIVGKETLGLLKKQFEEAI
jgi:hypothetical protein